VTDFVRKPITHIWLVAFVDVLTLGGQDIELGIERLRAHYVRLGYDVQVCEPWGPQRPGKRDHGYRRLYACRHVNLYAAWYADDEQSREQFRESIFRHAEHVSHRMDFELHEHRLTDGRVVGFHEAYYLKIDGRELDQALVFDPMYVQHTGCRALTDPEGVGLHAGPDYRGLVACVRALAQS